MGRYFSPAALISSICLAQDVFKEEQQGLETQILTLLPQSLGPPAMREAGKYVTRWQLSIYI
jgi:hypothetical protein